MKKPLLAIALAVRSILPGSPEAPAVQPPVDPVGPAQAGVSRFLDPRVERARAVRAAARRDRERERQRERQHWREVARREHERVLRHRHWRIVKQHALVHRILAAAKTKLGTPYAFGASGPYSFDCSGFTRWLFARFGRYLPHSARGQASVVRHVERPELRAGDLLFYSYGRLGSEIDHVEVYMGQGHQIGTSNPTEDLDIDPVDWDNLVAIGRAA